MSKATARARDIDVVFAIWTDDIGVSLVGCGGGDGQWWPLVGDNATTIGQMANGTVSKRYNWRVGKGALAPCPPYSRKEGWWARCERVRCLKSAVFRFSVMVSPARSLLFRRDDTFSHSRHSVFSNVIADVGLERGLVGDGLGAALGLTFPLSLLGRADEVIE